MVVATDEAFTPEEFGSSRLTPLIDAPLWLKAKSLAGGDGDRATLTPSDRAFLESPPTYEEGGSLLPDEPVVQVRTPSPMRRVASLLLFVVITGSACAVLGLAALRLLGR
jgi:hypothetical protein